MMDTSDTGSAFQPKKGDIDMKTSERLLFMALGGLLVLAVMIGEKPEWELASCLSDSKRQEEASDG